VIFAIIEAVELENQRNESSGNTGGAGAARHLANATREIEPPSLVDPTCLMALRIKVRCSAIELEGPRLS
jgi:hypothetical protein